MFVSLVALSMSGHTQRGTHQAPEPVGDPVESPACFVDRQDSRLRDLPTDFRIEASKRVYIPPLEARYCKLRNPHYDSFQKIKGCLVRLFVTET